MLSANDLITYVHIIKDKVLQTFAKLKGKTGYKKKKKKKEDCVYTLDLIIIKWCASKQGTPYRLGCFLYLVFKVWANHQLIKCMGWGEDEKC